MSATGGSDAQASAAERAMMPGLAPPPDISDEEALLYGMIIARLQRVVKDPLQPNDRRFIRDMRGAPPRLLSVDQRTHVMRLAWRYRFQLPAMLRPGRDPDAPQQETTQ